MTKAKVFSNYSKFQDEIPYISIGDVMQAFNDWTNSNEYQESKSVNRSSKINNYRNESYEDTLARNGEH